MYELESLPKTVLVANITILPNKINFGLLFYPFSFHIPVGGLLLSSFVPTFVSNSI